MTENTATNMMLFNSKLKKIVPYFLSLYLTNKRQNVGTDSNLHIQTINIFLLLTLSFNNFL